MKACFIVFGNSLVNLNNITFAETIGDNCCHVYVIGRERPLRIYGTNHEDIFQAINQAQEELARREQKQRACG